MDWSERFEIVKEKFEQVAHKPYKPGSLDSYLKITRGKSAHWEKGNKPSADDLALISKKLELSPAWLLTGEGDPEQHLDHGLHRTESSPDALAEEAKEEYLDRLGELLISYKATQEQIVWIMERVLAKKGSAAFWKGKSERLVDFPERMKKLGMTEQWIVPMLMAEYKTDEEVKRGAAG